MQFSCLEWKEMKGGEFFHGQYLSTLPFGASFVAKLSENLTRKPGLTQDLN